MVLTSRRSVPVGAPESAFAARRIVRELASQLGFAARDVEELALVASELATNIVKYATRGRIHVSPAGDVARGPGIQIVAEDEGPMFDLGRALPDGCDAEGKLDPAHLYGRRGIGTGLGTIARLTDVLRIEPTEAGKRIVVVRHLRRAR